ncbi:MAG: efflux RND transporter periplasmic adaptor subunit [Candidatus Roizmanbacteria bacterium]
MKNKLFSLHTGIFLASVIGATGIVTFLIAGYFTPSRLVKSETVQLKPVSTQIIAQGSIRSQNEASIHFQTAGRLVYLPFKEGEMVRAGQTIASLDSYTIKKQLQMALNSYRSTRDTFDQNQDNSKNNIMQGQQRNIVDASKAGIGTSSGSNDVVNDMVKRIADQNQAILDNSVIQVELANYAYTLASLNSPIDGMITHMDVTTPNVNVTATNTFSIADPDTLVFRANVGEDEINFITEGAQAQIKLSSATNSPLMGTVVKMYPEKFTMPTGENVYHVDISSNQLRTSGKYNQNGTVLINNKFKGDVMLVPAWVVLSKQYIWIMRDGHPVLQKIVTGDVVGDTIEVIQGLQIHDSIILNPASVVASEYKLL